MQWFFHWWRLRGRLKGIKRTSSSAWAPLTEKHDILHSFKRIKKIDGRITWPLDGDGRLSLSLRSLCTYFTILSVKFKTTLPLDPSWMLRQTKGIGKEEIAQSPMKKNFRDSAISSWRPRRCYCYRIELAFKRHQSTLNSVVEFGSKRCYDSVLIQLARTAWGHTSDQHVC